MISCMDAFRLSQIGKSSFRDADHDHENHDYDHDTQTFHIVRLHSRDHHRHVTTAKNGQKWAKTAKNKQNMAISRFGLF